MLARWGLGGVPIMVVVTLLSLFGWLITYFIHLFVLLPLPDLLRWGLGTLVAVLAPLPAVPLIALILRPVRCAAAGAAGIAARPGRRGRIAEGGRTQRSCHGR